VVRPGAFGFSSTTGAMCGIPTPGIGTISFQRRRPGRRLGPGASQPTATSVLAGRSAGLSDDQNLGLLTGGRIWRPRMRRRRAQAQLAEAAGDRLAGVPVGYRLQGCAGAVRVKDSRSSLRNRSLLCRMRACLRRCELRFRATVNARRYGGARHLRSKSATKSSRTRTSRTRNRERVGSSLAWRGRDGEPDLVDAAERLAVVAGEATGNPERELTEHPLAGRGWRMASLWERPPRGRSQPR